MPSRRQTTQMLRAQLRELKTERKELDDTIAALEKALNALDPGAPRQRDASPLAHRVRKIGEKHVEQALEAILNYLATAGHGQWQGRLQDLGVLIGMEPDKAFKGTGTLSYAIALGEERGSITRLSKPGGKPTRIALTTVLDQQTDPANGAHGQVQATVGPVQT